jgi:hypothetical protein
LHTQVRPELQYLQSGLELPATTSQALYHADQPIFMVEALQLAQHDLQTFMMAGGSIRRVGTDIVDFRHLDSEEIDDLTFAMEIEELHNEKAQTFMGSSSSATLIKKAIELKIAFTGKQIGLPKSYMRRPQFGVRSISLLESCHTETRSISKKTATSPVPSFSDYSFPTADLRSSLIDLYFCKSNSFFPALHKPTFLKAVAQGLHISDPDFGKVLLVICAIASLWSNDPRVLYPGSSSWHSAGWQWYGQTQGAILSQLETPSLHQVQYCAVSLSNSINICIYSDTTA